MTTEIYNKIRAECKERDLSLSELERKAGIGHGTISKWKYGICSPSMKTIVLIAYTLDIPTTRLI